MYRNNYKENISLVIPTSDEEALALSKKNPSLAKEILQ